MPPVYTVPTAQGTVLDLLGTNIISFQNTYKSALCLMSLLLAVTVSKQSQNACLSAEASAGCLLVNADYRCLSLGVYYTRGNSPCLLHSPLTSSISRASPIIIPSPWKAPQVCEQITGAIDPACALPPHLFSPGLGSFLFTSSLSPGSLVLSIC